MPDQLVVLPHEGVHSPQGVLPVLVSHIVEDLVRSARAALRVLASRSAVWAVRTSVMRASSQPPCLPVIPHRTSPMDSDVRKGGYRGIPVRGDPAAGDRSSIRSWRWRPWPCQIAGPSTTSPICPTGRYRRLARGSPRPGCGSRLPERETPYAIIARSGIRRSWRSPRPGGERMLSDHADVGVRPRGERLHGFTDTLDLRTGMKSSWKPMLPPRPLPSPPRSRRGRAARTSRRAPRDPRLSNCGRRTPCP